MNEKTTTGGTAEARVLDLLKGVRLTPTQRRIASYLVQHAPSIAYLSAAEVADLAGVSQPSVTRFATALGYAGYPAFRRELRRLVTATGTSAEQGSEPGGNPVQRALYAEAEQLYRLADSLGQLDRISMAAHLLMVSRPLPVLGLRAAAPLAAWFGYFATKIHPDVRVLDTGGSALLDRIDQAREAGAGAMLAVVLPRYPREAIDAAREAREAGLTIVTLTDSAISPAANPADIVLSASVGTQLVFDLHTGPMAVAMALLQAMCDTAPEAAQRRLEDFEAAAARRHIFVS